jgi:hypothetical protein
MRVIKKGVTLIHGVRIKEFDKSLHSRLTLFHHLLYYTHRDKQLEKDNGLHEPRTEKQTGS